MGVGKAARLNVRVTPAQHAEIARRAASAGLGVSEYVRRRALGDAGAPQIVADVETLRALHANLKRAGGNLNQVARELNTRHRADELAPAVESSARAVAEAAADVSGFVASVLNSI